MKAVTPQHYDCNATELRVGDLVGYAHDFQPIGTIARLCPTRVSVQWLSDDVKHGHLSKSLVLLRRPQPGEVLTLEVLGGK